MDWASPLGNLYAAISEADADATVERAGRHGSRRLDEGRTYFGARSTECDARAFRRSIARSASIRLQPAGIEKSHADSLRRLGIERVQILLLHDIDRAHHGEMHRNVVRQIPDEALPTLHAFKAAGHVDTIGLGINQWDVGYEILANAEIDCVLLAGRYTLID